MAGETLMGIGKFIAGALIGTLAMAIYHQTTPQPPTTLPVLGVSSSISAPSSTAPDTKITALTNQLDEYTELTNQLEDQIVELNYRLAELEKTQQQLLTRKQSGAGDAVAAVQVVPPAEVEQAKNKPGTLNIATLVDAGIDPQQADYILRRQGELDMLRLDLRDRAIREGTLGTKEYLNALRELNKNAPNLREEIGDDTYDRYLYASGQSNRVVVTSVIAGSAAEQAGIREGDMILDYGSDKVFTWPELRKATTQGYRGEYITVNVQRDSQILSLLVPRGPLGVRLSTSSKLPLDPSGY
jgi:hypothetical protein